MCLRKRSTKPANFSRMLDAVQRTLYYLAEARLATESTDTLTVLLQHLLQGRQQQGVGMKEIPLTQGKVALVDDKDYERLSQYKWHVSGDGKYAARHSRCPACRHRHVIYMHRAVLGLGDTPTDSKTHVDHINADGLDNRSDNLRVCLHGANLQRGRTSKIARAGFIGIHKKGRRWGAQRSVDGKSTYLGSFSTKGLAALAYDCAVLSAWGIYARTNYRYVGQKS